MQVPISKRLLDYFNCPIEDEPKLRKELNSRLNTTCKPCWELKYCPYGPLVEDFPLPPLLLSEHNEHIEYLKECLKTGKMGSNHDVPIDEHRKELFQREIERDYSDYCVDKHSKFEKESSCKEFRHLCPAFFVSEPFTETSVGRNRSRSVRGYRNRSRRRAIMRRRP